MDDQELIEEAKQEFDRIHKMFEGEKMFATLSHNDDPEFDEQQEKEYEKRADKDLGFLLDSWKNLGNTKS